MVSYAQHSGLLIKPKLRRLHDVQEEIYRQLQLLIPEQVAWFDSFQSRVDGSPLLKMDVLERHPYTQFLRLTYVFENSLEQQVAPDAHIRAYIDARMAEVTAFDHDQGCRRTASPYYPQRQLFEKNWRLNLALNKWLGYLLMQGHSITTMSVASDCIKVNQPDKTATALALNLD